MKPTKRPKTLQVRVAPETHNTICRIAELSDQTISMCVNELLESLLPGLKKTLEYLENANKLDAQARATLARTLEGHENELREHVKNTMDKVGEEIRQHKLPL